MPFLLKFISYYATLDAHANYIYNFVTCFIELILNQLYIFYSEPIFFVNLTLFYT